MNKNLRLKTLFAAMVIFGVFGLAKSSMAAALTLTHYPNHEDSSVSVEVNLNEIEQNYSPCCSQMGVVLSKVNGIFNSEQLSAHSRFINFPATKSTYDFAISNLEPDTNYEFCLNGLRTDGRSLDNFDCQTIRTASKKPSVAVILKNYDLDSEINNLITSWIGKVETKNSSLVVEEVNISAGTTSSQLYNLLAQKYQSENLRYIVMIGWDLPVPTITAWGQQYQSTMPYQSLSFDVTNNDNGLLNPSNSLNEVIISAIRPNNRAEMVSYFNRLIDYYNGNKTYEKSVFVANAMIPSESQLTQANFINQRYAESAVTYINGITSYSSTSEGNAFQGQYSNYLPNSYEIFILNAHGATTYHYPCGSTTCINSNFINNLHPNFLAMIAVSCNIGNFMTTGSPMASYIFDGSSLVGVSAETPLMDDGRIAKNVYGKFTGGNGIADSASGYGFTIIGDPFIKLSCDPNTDIGCVDTIPPAAPSGLSVL